MELSEEQKAKVVQCRRTSCKNEYISVRHGSRGNKSFACPECRKPEQRMVYFDHLAEEYGQDFSDQYRVHLGFNDNYGKVGLNGAGRPGKSWIDPSRHILDVAEMPREITLERMAYGLISTDNAFAAATIAGLKVSPEDAEQLAIDARASHPDILACDTGAIARLVFQCAGIALLRCREQLPLAPVQAVKGLMDTSLKAYQIVNGDIKPSYHAMTIEVPSYPEPDETAKN